MTEDLPEIGAWYKIDRDRLYPDYVKVRQHVRSFVTEEIYVIFEYDTGKMHMLKLDKFNTWFRKARNG